LRQHQHSTGPEESRPTWTAGEADLDVQGMLAKRACPTHIGAAS
jgi:hypothetical protein